MHLVEEAVWHKMYTNQINFKICNILLAMHDNNDQVIVGIIPKKIYVMNEWMNDMCIAFIICIKNGHMQKICFTWTYNAK